MVLVVLQGLVGDGDLSGAGSGDGGGRGDPLPHAGGGPCTPWGDRGRPGPEADDLQEPEMFRMGHGEGAGQGLTLQLIRGEATSVANGGSDAPAWHRPWQTAHALALTADRHRLPSRLQLCVEPPGTLTQPGAPRARAVALDLARLHRLRTLVRWLSHA